MPIESLTPMVFPQDPKISSFYLLPPSPFARLAIGSQELKGSKELGHLVDPKLGTTASRFCSCRILDLEVIALRWPPSQLTSLPFWHQLELLKAPFWQLEAILEQFW